MRKLGGGSNTQTTWAKGAGSEYGDYVSAMYDLIESDGVKLHKLTIYLRDTDSENNVLIYESLSSAKDSRAMVEECAPNKVTLSCTIDGQKYKICLYRSGNGNGVLTVKGVMTEHTEELLMAI